MSATFSPTRPQQGQPTAIKPKPHLAGSTGRVGENLSFPDSQIPKTFTPTPPQAPRRAAPVKPSTGVPYDAIPPHSDEVERCVLGSMLISKMATEYAIRFLAPVLDAFYMPRNRALFTLFASTYKIKKSLDEQIAVASLRPPNNTDEIRNYIARLITETSSAANIEGYSNTLLDLRHERMRLEFGLWLVADVLKNSGGGPAK